MKVQKILFPTDFSASSEAALGQAIFLAERYEAELHLLHAVVLHEFDPNNPDKEFPDAEDLFRRMFEIADSRMDSLLKQHGRDPLTVKEAKRRGVSASEVILAYAEEIDADLIVMGTHGRRGPARLFLGSVAEAVIRHSDCPVLTVRSSSDGHELEPAKKILVPVDFSESSKLSLRYAEALAHVHHAALEIVYVVEQIPYPYFYVPAEDDVLTERTRQAGEALGELAVETLTSSIAYETTVLSGRAATEIVERAKTADLLVIGTHGLTGVERLLVGSTAEQVIREADCPVFVVKSRGKVVL